MPHNIFEELKNKKDNLRSLAQKAKQYGWIDEQREKDIVNKIDNDTLCIGVIGQMKCGKSTFLNSFVFNDDVLPAATTPMTAALSIITYGTDKKIVAEFYSENEWAEQKMTAERTIDEDMSDSEISRIKAAKELIEKSGKLSSLNSYLGKTQDDKFENLIEYVGADGKFVSITKSVTIYYPEEYLKGVEIVDTPGFNDPIVSREERTKEFLKKADVVLLILYAGRPFDATDRDILFKNVKSCGVGKVLVGINKYDIPYGNGESEDQIVEYVSQEILKASDELGDEYLKDILYNTEPIPFSAEMALLAGFPMQKISSNDVYKYNWNHHCNTFEISSQSEMMDKSHINNIIQAVKNLIYKEKENILIAKPLNTIKAAGICKKNDLANKKLLLENEIKLLSIPDFELEDKEAQLEKAERRLTKKINSLGEDIEADFKSIIRKGKLELEDIVFAFCNKINNEIDNWGRFENEDDLKTKINVEYDILTSRKLPRALGYINEEAERKIKSTVAEFFDDVQNIFDANLDDFDTNDFVKNVSRKVELEIDNKNLLISDVNYWFSNDSYKKTLGNIGYKLQTILDHNDIVNYLRKEISSFSAEFNPDCVLERIMKNKDVIINTIKSDFIDELIVPMKSQLLECKSTKTDKENKIVEDKKKLDIIKQSMQIIENQLSEINKA